MKFQQYILRFVGVAFTLAVLMNARNASATSYYVNCAASSNGTGTSASPWNTLSSPNAHAFVAGDNIYFNRGTTCDGEFSPSGSGTSSSPITVSAYGSGAIPIIDGQSNSAVFALTNQSYWTIENLELLHGVYYGLDVYADNNTAINGIYVTDVTATGATHTSTSRNDSGEIYIVADAADSATVSNSGVYGAWAGNTKVSEGIYISAGNYLSMTGAKGSNIYVENSTVSDVYGDGILVTNANNVTYTSNVVTESGECPSCGSSTPGAIWVWNTSNAVMSWNESYANSSWGGDGGGLDIDYWNTNVTAEYNYVHDNKGYCVSVFGAGNEATVNSIIRFNICINNDNWGSSMALGDFFLNTWGGGTLNGVEIYNNTSYWDSTLSNVDTLDDAASFSGSNPSFFKNNLIYSPLEYPGMVNASSPITLSNNLYYSSSSTPQYWFGYNGTWWDSFSTYQNDSGEDNDSIVANPLLGDPGYDVNNSWPDGDQYTPQSGSPAIGAGVNVCSGISGCSMGSYDFLGKSLPSSGFWIGAIQE